MWRYGCFHTPYVADVGFIPVARVIFKPLLKEETQDVPSTREIV